MVKVLYAIKMYMFKDQIPDMTDQERRCVQELTEFSISLYLRAWFSAVDSSKAPFQDMQLHNRLHGYHNTYVGKDALKKLESHLWYLSEELVSLAFFDSHVSCDTKRAMVEALENEGSEINGKRRVSLGDVKLLEQLITKNSKKLLEALPIELSFLQHDPRDWEEN